MAIPMPELPGGAFLKGLNTGSQLYSRMMQPRLKREELEFLKQKHAEDLALRKAASGRAAAAASDAHKLAMMRLDPLAAFKQMVALQNQMGGGQANGQPTQEQSYMPGIGGMFGQQPQELQEPEQGQFPVNEQQMIQEGMQEPQQGQYPALQQKILNPMEQQQGGIPALNEQAINPMEAGVQKPSNGLDMERIKRDPMLRSAYKKLFGIDPAAQTPEDKLQEKMRLHAENRKFDIEHPTKGEVETPAEKRRLDVEAKTKALEEKELIHVRKDLPTIEKSLKGVNELIRIAKNNPDLFGHGFAPDRFAKVTKSKEFGKWQNLISDAIAGLEQKLSAKGNVVALKMASQLKPSHAEQQNVAIGKLESMKSQLEDALANSKEQLGQKGTDDDMTKKSDSELQAILAGG